VMGMKAVHAAELERERQGQLALHDAQRAAGVADGVTQEPATEGATHNRADAPDEVVLAGVRAVALDQAWRQSCAAARPWRGSRRGHSGDRRRGRR